MRRSTAPQDDVRVSLDASSTVLTLRSRAQRAISTGTAQFPQINEPQCALVQRSRDSGVHVRLLRHAREQDCELGLTIRIRLRQDCLEMLAYGSDADFLFIGNFLEIAPTGKADCD